LSLTERVQGVWRRLAGVEAAADSGARKTTMLPSIMTAYGSGRLGQQMMKPTAVNLRRFAETPVARRAINVVKDKIACMDWQVKVRRGYVASDVPFVARRLKALRLALQEPNAGDSFRTLFEQVLEDVLVGGFGSVEMELTGDPAQPFRLWAVDGATIHVDGTWDGDPATPRYGQATGKVGKDAVVPLLDDELMYIRLNPRTHTAFGLGRLEVAFETVNQFLGANRYAGKLASNSVVQYALWLNETTPEQHERLIHWWQDEIEGTGKVPILSCEQKPEVLRFAGGTDADLHLQWQEFLLRMIANAFELPPMMLGISQDLNKANAAEMADEAFQSAIVPVAKLLAEHITREVFAKRLGWREFEFVFNDLEARDPMEELSVQTELLQAGVLTVDEVRAMRGLSPLGHGMQAGDESGNSEAVLP
jgi:HK97 family phage portal protein